MNNYKNDDDNLIYLSASDKSDISKYKGTLDKVLKSTNKYAKNIAISGSYGSGKSSVIESYKNESGEKDNFTHIVFGNFGDKNEVEQNYLEKHIITQILYQTPKKRLYESAFTVKKPINKFEIVIQSLLFVISILVLSYDVFLLPKDKFIADYNLFGFWHIFNFYSRTVILNLFSLIIFIYIVYSLFKTIKIKGILKRLKLKNAEFEMFDNKNDSYIDKYLSELLFLFEISQSRIFIFEDLDRFGKIEIFEKLRELNYLLNSNIDKEQVYKFVYLIKDDLFENNNERVKFFDYIIPIIPIIDINNSNNMLERLSENQFSYDFINLISLYISDMRLLKNIINEYIIYKNEPANKKKIINYDIIGDNSFEATNNLKNREKLFSLILYKNLFPQDFSELQNGAGVLHYLLNSKNELIELSVSELKVSLQNFEKEIEALKNKNLQSLTDILSLIPLYKTNSMQSLINAHDYMDELKSNKEIYKHSTIARNHLILLQKNEREVLINAHIDTKTQVDEKIEKMNNEITKCKNEINIQSSLKLSEVFNINKLKVYTKVDETLSIHKFYGKYLELINTLILNSYIDNTYYEYISISYDMLLSFDDQIFLKKLHNKNTYQFNSNLDKVENIYSKIKNTELIKSKYVLNLRLFNHILKIEDTNLIEIFINNIKANIETYTFFAEFIKSFKISELLDSKFKVEDDIYNKKLFDLLLSVLLIKWSEFFILLINGFNNNDINLFSKEEISIFSKYLLMYFDNDKLELLPSEMKYYYQNNLILFNEESELVYTRNIEIIALLNLKFDNLLKSDNVSYELIYYIYKNNNYDISISNLKYLINRLNLKNEEYKENFENIAFTIISQLSDNNMLDYISINIEMFLEEYTKNCNSIKDSKEYSYKIINNNSIDICLRAKYIDNYFYKINQLEEIDNRELQKHLIKSNKVDGSLNNLRYLMIISKELYSNEENSQSEFILSDEIIEWINNVNIFESKENKHIENDSKLFTLIVKCDEIDDSVYFKIVDYLNYKISVVYQLNISETKIKFLIENEIMTIEDSDDVKKVRELYPNYKFNFYAKKISVFLKIVEEDNNILDKSEIKTLLEDYTFKEDIFKRLLPLAEEFISLEKIHPKIETFSIETRLEVINQYAMDENYENINYLNKIYGKYNDEIESIKSIYIENIDEIIKNVTITNLKLFVNLISSNEINLNKQFELYANVFNNQNDTNDINQEIFIKILQNIPIKEAKNYKDNIKELMVYNNYESEFYKIFVNARPLLTNNNKNKKLICELSRLKLIGKTNENDNNKIRINSKKLN